MQLCGGSSVCSHSSAALAVQLLAICQGLPDYLCACRDMELFPGLEDQGKTSMKDLFGVPVIKKDGTEGKVSIWDRLAEESCQIMKLACSPESTCVPFSDSPYLHHLQPAALERCSCLQTRRVLATELLQESEEHRQQWIDYSAKDAEATLRLYHRLQELLRQA